MSALHSKQKQRTMTSFARNKQIGTTENRTAPSAPTVSKNDQLRVILQQMSAQKAATAAKSSSSTSNQNNPYYAPILDKIAVQRKQQREAYVKVQKKLKTKDGKDIDLTNGGSVNHFHGPTHGDHSGSKRGWTGYFEHRKQKMKKQFDENEQSDVYQNINSTGVRFGKRQLKHTDAKQRAIKKQKLLAKDGQPIAAARTAAVPSTSNIFEGVTVYFNGRTENLSSFHLNKLVLMHGGSFNVHLNSKVTHVVSGRMCRSKIKRSLNKTGKSRAHYVRSEWIHDSVACQKRLNEHDYLIFKSNAHGDISNFFQTANRS